MVRNILSKMLALCFCLEAGIAFSVDTETHPQVGDWDFAIDNEALVRIPLQNTRGHAWYASLQMGTPL